VHSAFLDELQSPTAVRMGTRSADELQQLQKGRIALRAQLPKWRDAMLAEAAASGTQNPMLTAALRTGALTSLYDTYVQPRLPESIAKVAAVAVTNAATWLAPSAVSLPSSIVLLDKLAAELALPVSLPECRPDDPSAV
jgi:hypothetical protein